MLQRFATGCTLLLFSAVHWVPVPGLASDPAFVPGRVSVGLGDDVWIDFSHRVSAEEVSKKITTASSQSRTRTLSNDGAGGTLSLTEDSGESSYNASAICPTDYAVLYTSHAEDITFHPDFSSAENDNGAGGGDAGEKDREGESALSGRLDRTGQFSFGHRVSLAGTEGWVSKVRNGVWRNCDLAFRVVRVTAADKDDDPEQRGKTPKSRLCAYRCPLRSSSQERGSVHAYAVVRVAPRGTGGSGGDDHPSGDGAGAGGGAKKGGVAASSLLLSSLSSSSRGARTRSSDDAARSLSTEVLHSGTFRVPRRPSSFTAYAVGDVGVYPAASAVFSLAGELAEADEPELVLHPGDLAYSDFGRARWDRFSRIVSPLTRRSVYMTAVGNHDDRESYDALWGYKGPVSIPGGIPLQQLSYALGLKDVNAMHGIAQYTSRGHEEDTPVYGGALSSSAASSAAAADAPQYYAFAFGPLYVAVLSTEEPLTRGTRQHEWLRSALSLARAGSLSRVLVVVAHVPIYSSSDGHGGQEYLLTHPKRNGVAPSEAVRSAIEDVLREFGASLYIAGDDHGYERTFPVWREKVSVALGGFAQHLVGRQVSLPVVPEDGVISAVVGTGGATLDGWQDPAKKPEWSSVRKASYGFLRLKVASSWKAHRVRGEFVEILDFEGMEKSPTAGSAGNADPAALGGTVSRGGVRYKVSDVFAVEVPRVDPPGSPPAEGTPTGPSGIIIVLASLILYVFLNQTNAFNYRDPTARHAAREVV